MFRQLADRGGFACAVHSYQHDDEGFMRGGLQWLRQWIQQLEQTKCKGFPELYRVAQMLLFDLMAQIGKQRIGRVHADIGSDQDGFKFLIQIVIYPSATAKQFRQLPSGMRQPGLQLTDPVGVELVSGSLVFFRFGRFLFQEAEHWMNLVGKCKNAA